MSRSIDFGDFLAGVTRFEFCCLDCPRLYVREMYAAQHGATRDHAIGSRVELADVDPSQPHSFVACLPHGYADSGVPRRFWTEVCCLCSRPRSVHEATR